MPSPTLDPDDLPPDEETSEDLVAYLDGELDAADSRSVESKLAEDDGARRKLETLKKTYDLLDYLPAPEPSATFASRTLTQLNLSAPPGAVAPSNATAPVYPAAATSGFVLPPKPRSLARFLAGWSLALAVAGALGYFGHLLARPHLEAFPSKRTSEQVRLLERLPLYLGVDDIDFARQLEAPELFGEAAHDGLPARAPDDTLTSSELELLENVFKSYPPARQEQLRKLDDDIAALEPRARSTLLETLERYAVWLDRLPDNHRREILTARAAYERLETVHLVKARLWREGLPASVRERIQNVEPAQRDQIVADIKQQDARRRSTWEIARREWANIRADRRPWPFENEELTKRVHEYVDGTLRPRLTAGERNELDALRRDLGNGSDWFKWYLYGHAISRFVDLHPTLPEPASGKLVKSVGDLPSEFVQQLRKKAGPGRRQLQQNPASNKWPDFAEFVVHESRDLKVPLPPGLSLGPTKPEEYSPAVRQFLETELDAKLSAAESKDLKRLESSPWPEHSRKVLELARKHDLSVPGVMPPGSPSQWDATYRNRPGKK
jgi:hypothetical protein